MATAITILDSVFGSKFNDEKGKRFEQNCRKILGSNSFEVLQHAVTLPFQYLPSDVSLKLWQRVKSSSDIDVIGRNEKHLFLIECKERSSFEKKVRLPRKFFVNLVVDLKHKAEWIQTHFREFSEIVGSDWIF